MNIKQEVQFLQNFRNEKFGEPLSLEEILEVYGDEVSEEAKRQFAVLERKKDVPDKEVIFENLRG